MKIGDLLAWGDWFLAALVWAAGSSWFDWIGFGLLAACAVAGAWWAYCAPGFAVVSRTLHHEKPGLIRIALTTADMLGVVLCLPFLAGPGKVTTFARLRVEWELMRHGVNRQPPRFLEAYYAKGADAGTPQERHRLQLWRDEAVYVRQRIRMFRWLAQRSRGRAPAWRLLRYVLEHRARRARWLAWAAERRMSNEKQTERDRLRWTEVRVRPKRPPPDPHLPIHVPNCFAITERLDRIDHYFKTLELLQSTHWRPFFGWARRLDQISGGGRGKAHDPFGATWRFEAEVEIGEGFVAPLHLVAGLSAEFEDDWRPPIEDFGARLAKIEFGMPVARERLERLRAFQFVCWLTWGPSIPICGCPFWREWSSLPVLQYGFGDEANSLPLVVEHDDPIVQTVCEAGGRALALSAPVVRLERGAWIDEARVAPPLRGIRADDSVVLRAEGPLADPARARRRPSRSSKVPTRPYYSAYVWVMFEVVDAAACGDAPTDIHRLMPFFEHGDIADERLYASARDQLVAKTLSALVDLVSVPGVAFRYACAIDESNCGHGSPIAPPPADSDIRARMVAALSAADASDRYPGLTAHGLGLETKGSALCSCVMPGVVASYFGKLRENEEA